MEAVVKSSSDLEYNLKVELLSKRLCERKSQV